MRNIYLSKFYWKLKQRSCAKKAVVALARKILVIIYNLIKNNDVYKEEKFEQPMQKQESSRIKRISAEAMKLGYVLISLDKTS